MDESTSSADLELLLREIQVLEEENFVLSDAQETIEASLSSPKAHSEHGDLNAPSGHKVRVVKCRFRLPRFRLPLCVYWMEFCPTPIVRALGIRSHMSVAAENYFVFEQARTRKQEKLNIPTTLTLTKRNQLAQQLLERQKNDIQKLKQKTDKVLLPSLAHACSA